MSAASTPAPRVGPPSASRHSLFLPMLVLLLGIGAQSSYQVIFLEDQLASVTAQVDQMDAKVKWSEYNQNKFFSLSKAVQALAPKDANAAQIARDFKIRPAPISPLEEPLTPTTHSASALTNSATDVAPSAAAATK